MLVILIPVAFFGIAFLYSLVGFGGGSSYIAILAVSGFPIQSIPLLALGCNLIVSAQGSIMLARSGHVSVRLLLPLLGGSIPAAFLGGALRFRSDVLLVVLASVLVLAGLALLIPTTRAEQDISGQQPAGLVTLGGFLGLIAGISGIGGGIFLSPALHLLRLGNARAIAASAAVFIAMNSLAGILGQLSKGMDRLSGLSSWVYLACPLAVFAGGMLGSRNLVTNWDGRRIRAVTGCLVLLVALRLWLKILAHV